VQMLTRSIVYLRGRNPALPTAVLPFLNTTDVPGSPMFPIPGLRFVVGDQFTAACTRGQL